MGRQLKLRVRRLPHGLDRQARNAGLSSRVTPKGYFAALLTSDSSWLRRPAVRVASITVRAPAKARRRSLVRPSLIDEMAAKHVKHVVTALAALCARLPCVAESSVAAEPRRAVSVARHPDRSARRDTRRARSDPHPGWVCPTRASASPFVPRPRRPSAAARSARRCGTAGIAR
jgi:hypothetical protein